MSVIRVGVLGAGGRMGRAVCHAVAEADGLELVAAVDPNAAGEQIDGVEVAQDHDALTDAGVEVCVDFTRPSAVADNIRWLLEHGIHAVVGTTGLSDDDLADIERRAGGGDARVFLAPNFAIGAVLMMRFATEAARHMPDVEIIELHHDGKADAPSGTALRTADLIAKARGDADEPVMGEVIDGARGADRERIRVHSVRLPGLVAHQEVLLGGEGQLLTIRHDSYDRTSFMPGVILAVRRVPDLPDPVTVGLEVLLFEG